MSFLLVSTEPNNSSNFASNSSCKSFENNSSSLVLSSIGSTGASSCFFTFSTALGWACGVGGVIGYSTSDQIMGRALMTPDELRRMDNELCIIFEKGLKPIKANKFYYFRNQNMNRRLNQNRLDHNNFDSGVRG